MIRDASISECGRYRWWLRRVWDAPLLNDGRFQGVINFVMLNPSTADAEIDDPTIRRCIAYAKSWGYGGLTVTNLYAFRSTDPRELKRATNPVGEWNSRYVREFANDADMTVCAWGNNAEPYHAQEVLGWLLESSDKVTALRVSKTGQPCHPLYLPGNLEPQPFGAVNGGA